MGRAGLEGWAQDTEGGGGGGGTLGSLLPQKGVGSRRDLVLE